MARPDEASASALAASCQQSVAVSSLTTPTQSAAANPDGSVTMTIDAGPVRVQQSNGSWLPIDTGLVVSGSTITPKAASVSMSFSDGGGVSVPLATITQAGHSYSLLSPWTLPTPVISGSTATYLAVQPGVDLVVQAFPDGFSDNLVVETPAAAAALVASPATFPVKTTGVRQVQDPVSGTVREIGSDGATVFSGDAPSMWDSTGAPAAGVSQGTAASVAAAVTGESPTARVAQMVETVTASSVRLAPSSTMLTTTGLMYPLVLDPVTKTQSISGWTVLDQEYASHAYWKDSPDPAGDISVGYDDYGTGSVRRSVVQFNTSALAGKHILGATYTPYDDVFGELHGL